MHHISEAIEQDHQMVVLCPACGFAFDIVAMFDAVMNGDDIAAVVQGFHEMEANVGGSTSHLNEDASPLLHMMVANGAKIEATIKQWGPAFVANWFMNAAASVASGYDLVATGDMDQPFTKKG